MPSKRPVRTAEPEYEDEDDNLVEGTAPEGNGDTTTAEARPPRVAGHDKLKAGWGASRRVIESTTQWAQTFRPDEKSQVIRFMQDIPYVAIRRHWVETTSFDDKGKPTKSNRPYTCLETIDEKCPLCEIGDRPQAVSCFNIVLLDANGDIARKSWDVGSRLFNVLDGYANDPKIGPLTRGFFLVSKTGQKSSTQYNVSPIKASALEEDYDIAVPSDADLRDVQLYDTSIIEIPPAKKLRELADSLMDDYGDD